MRAEMSWLRRGGDDPHRPQRRALITDQRGAGSLLIVSVMTVIVVVTCLIAWVVAALVQLRHVRDIADVVALSAGNEFCLSADATKSCAVAQQYATRNHVTLTQCDVAGVDQWSFTITVTVRLDHPTAMRYPTVLVASATSGYDIATMTRSQP